MNRIALVLLALLGCADVSTGSATLALSGDAGALAATCVDPATYGALPDDGVDDRPGIQQAIDDNPGATVCFRTGLYELSRDDVYRRFASLTIEHSVHLVGSPGSVLQMTGDGGQSDWYLIRLSRNAQTLAPVNDVSIRGLTLTNGGAYNTEEQTHLIQIGMGPVSRVDISGMFFKLPSLGPNAGGDCIRLVGEMPTPVEQISIHDNFFVVCDRSGVSVQRGVNDVLIASNQFLKVGDSHIDFEPTGTGAASRIGIDGNLFLGNGSGIPAVTLSGSSNAHSTDLSLTRNIFTGGSGVWTYGIKRALIADNIISGVFPQGRSLIEMIKTSDDVRISGNNLRQLAGSGTQAIVKVSHHNSGNPVRVSIDGNTLATEVANAPINIDSASDLTVANNQFLTASSAMPVILLTAINASMDRIVVTGNRSNGPAASFLSLRKYDPYKIGAVSVVGNMVSGVVGPGVSCQGAGSLSKPIVHASNYYEAPATATSCIAVHWTSGIYSFVGSYP